MIEQKELGNTGVFISEIGLGTWRYRGTAETLRAGIELGATLIDTAEGYYTEDVVGEAVKGIRDKVFIATKVSGRHLAHDDVLQSAEESLYKLGTDYIDLYQIHWPNHSYPIRETIFFVMAVYLLTGLCRTYQHSGTGNVLISQNNFECSPYRGEHH